MSIYFIAKKFERLSTVVRTDNLTTEIRLSYTLLLAISNICLNRLNYVILFAYIFFEPKPKLAHEIRGWLLRMVRRRFRLERYIIDTVRLHNKV